MNGPSAAAQCGMEAAGVWLVAQTGLVTADIDIDIWNDTDTMAAPHQHAHVGWIHVIHVRVSCYGGPVVRIVIRYCDTYCDTW